MWSKKDVIAELKKQGKRITEQRKLLIGIILENEWQTCKEIYYKAIKIDSSIGIATVYRMVSILEEIGALGRRSNYLVMPLQEDSGKEKCNLSIICNGKEIQDKNGLYQGVKALLEEQGYFKVKEILIIDKAGYDCYGKL